MNSYKMSVDGNVLKVGFNPEAPASGDVCLLDAITQLEGLIDQGLIGGGQLLKINGAQSVPIAFMVAHRVCHLYGAVAVYDPKMGGYLVAMSHNPSYKVGELIS